MWGYSSNHYHIIHVKHATPGDTYPRVTEGYLDINLVIHAEGITRVISWYLLLGLLFQVFQVRMKYLIYAEGINRLSPSFQLEIHETRTPKDIEYKMCGKPAA